MELASVSETKRNVTIRANPDSRYPCVLLVVPKSVLLDCSNYRKNTFTTLRNGISTGAESNNLIAGQVMDYARLSGLANRVDASELLKFAQHVKKRILKKGEILFMKDERVRQVYLIVSGDFLLDTEIGPKASDKSHFHPFLHSDISKCYCLSQGSILGDEGLTGQNSVYEATAVALTDLAVVFAIPEGPSMMYMKSKVDVVRYAALTYMDQSRWSKPISRAEETNIYTNFNSLRKCIAATNIHRGTANKIVAPVEIVLDKATDKKNKQTEKDKKSNSTHKNNTAAVHVEKNGRSPGRTRKVQKKGTTPKEKRVYMEFDWDKPDIVNGFDKESEFEKNKHEFERKKQILDSGGKVDGEEKNIPIFLSENALHHAFTVCAAVRKRSVEQAKSLIRVSI